jgi:glycosyltransferase involved in cell wall biosynthesis
MVSVIIPVYNAEKTIGRAIHSVLIQPFVNQLILVNDASTDTSYKVMSLIKKRYAATKWGLKMELLNLNTKGGVSAARNKGLEYVTSPFLTFLDADDEYLPNRFIRDVLLLFENFTIDGVYAPVRVRYECDTAKIIHHGIHYEEEIINAVIDEKKSLYASFMGSAGNYFLLSGLLIRTRLLNLIGLFDPAYLYCQDTDWLLRVITSLKLSPSRVNKPLIIIWRHQNNRILVPYLPALYRYQLLWQWMPFTLTRKDFTFKQRLFYVHSLFLNPLASQQRRWITIKKGLILGITNPRIIIWLLLG